jgi:hypothetical protein
MEPRLLLILKPLSLCCLTIVLLLTADRSAIAFGSDVGTTARDETWSPKPRRGGFVSPSRHAEYQLSEVGDAPSQGRMNLTPSPENSPNNA